MNELNQLSDVQDSSFPKIEGVENKGDVQDSSLPKIEGVENKGEVQLIDETRNRVNSIDRNPDQLENFEALKAELNAELDQAFGEGIIPPSSLNAAYYLIDDFLDKKSNSVNIIDYKRLGKEADRMVMAMRLGLHRRATLQQIHVVKQAVLVKKLENDANERLKYAKDYRLDPNLSAKEMVELGQGFKSNVRRSGLNPEEIKTYDDYQEKFLELTFDKIRERLSELDLDPNNVTHHMFKRLGF